MLKFCNLTFMCGTDVASRADGDSEGWRQIVWTVAARQTRGLHHPGHDHAAEESVGRSDQETPARPTHRTQDQTVQDSTLVSCKRLFSTNFNTPDMLLADHKRALLNKNLHTLVVASEIFKQKKYIFKHWSSNLLCDRPLRQTCSLDSNVVLVGNRTLSVDDSVSHSSSPAPSQPIDEDVAWSSDYTNSEEDEPVTEHVSLTSCCQNLQYNLVWFGNTS